MLEASSADLRPTIQSFLMLAARDPSPADRVPAGSKWVTPASCVQTADIEQRDDPRWRDLVLGLVSTSLVLAGLALAGCGVGSAAGDQGIAKIRHVVVIMQENRSFDSYFGTFPGADGIPMRGGVPTVCMPDPLTGQCERPYVDHADMNGGGPHAQLNATLDIDGSKMDGFVGQARSGYRDCLDTTAPVCGGEHGCCAHGTAGDQPGTHLRSHLLIR
jgi:hypothetical protein